MRLSLRTLLAFEDNIFDFEYRKELERRIPNQHDAAETLRRIRICLRQRRLGVPGIVSGIEELDPNLVAEYFDHQLGGEETDRFESRCLDSDVYLAEVASCHQILTSVLGEPARVTRDCRIRCYDIPRRPNIIPFPSIPTENPTKTTAPFDPTFLRIAPSTVLPPDTFKKSDAEEPMKTKERLPVSGSWNTSAPNETGSPDAIDFLARRSDEKTESVSEYLRKRRRSDRGMGRLLAAAVLILLFFCAWMFYQPIARQIGQYRENTNVNTGPGFPVSEEVALPAPNPAGTTESFYDSMASSVLEPPEVVESQAMARTLESTATLPPPTFSPIEPEKADEKTLIAAVPPSSDPEPTPSSLSELPEPNLYSSRLEIPVASLTAARHSEGLSGGASENQTLADTPPFPSPFEAVPSPQSSPDMEAFHEPKKQPPTDVGFGTGNETPPALAPLLPPPDRGPIILAEKQKEESSSPVRPQEEMSKPAAIASTPPSSEEPIPDPVSAESSRVEEKIASDSPGKPNPLRLEPTGEILGTPDSSDPRPSAPKMAKRDSMHPSRPIDTFRPALPTVTPVPVVIPILEGPPTSSVSPVVEPQPLSKVITTEDVQLPLSPLPPGKEKKHETNNEPRDERKPSQTQTQPFPAPEEPTNTVERHAGNTEPQAKTQLAIREINPMSLRFNHPAPLAPSVLPAKPMEPSAANRTASPYHPVVPFPEALPETAFAPEGVWNVSPHSDLSLSTPAAEHAPKASGEILPTAFTDEKSMKRENARTEQVSTTADTEKISPARTADAQAADPMTTNLIASKAGSISGVKTHSEPIIGRTAPTSDRQSYLVFSAVNATAPWKPGLGDGPLDAGQYLLTASPFRVPLELGEGLQIEMVGDSKLCVLEPDAEGTPGIFVDYGRFVIRSTLSTAPRALRIESEKGEGRLMLPPGKGLVFIDTFAEITLPGKSPRKGEKTENNQGNTVKTIGTTPVTRHQTILGIMPIDASTPIVWQNGKDVVPIYKASTILFERNYYDRAALRSEPGWLNAPGTPEGVASLAETARTIFEEHRQQGAGGCEKPLEVMLVHPIPNVRALAYRLWGDLGKFEVPLALLSEEETGEEEILNPVRQVLVAYFREVMRRDSETIERLSDTVSAMKSEE